MVCYIETEDKLPVSVRIQKSATKSPEQFQKEFQIQVHAQKYGDTIMRRTQSQEALKSSREDLGLKRSIVASFVYSRLIFWKRDISWEQAKAILDRIRETMKNDLAYREIRERMKTHEGRESLRIGFGIQNSSVWNAELQANLQTIEEIKNVNGDASNEWENRSVASIDVTENSTLPTLDGDISSSPVVEPISDERLDIEKAKMDTEIENAFSDVDVTELTHEQIKIETVIAESEYRQWQEEYVLLAKSVDDDIDLDTVRKHFTSQLENEDIPAPQNDDTYASIDFSQNPAYVAEIEWSQNVSVTKNPDGTYSLIGVPEYVDPSWDTTYNSQQKAEQIKIRSELLQEPPFDTFLRWEMKDFERWRNDPEITKIWNLSNPGEPFTDMSFRRLLMIGMMKKMNPEKYGKMSFNQIEKWQWKSVLAQFRETYQTSRWNLWLMNAGKEDIRKILSYASVIVSNKIPDWPPEAL